MSDNYFGWIVVSSLLISFVIHFWPIANKDIVTVVINALIIACSSILTKWFLGW